MFKDLIISNYNIMYDTPNEVYINTNATLERNKINEKFNVTAGPYNTLSTCDYNGDGAVDILFTRSGENNILFENKSINNIGNWIKINLD